MPEASTKLPLNWLASMARVHGSAKVRRGLTLLVLAVVMPSGPALASPPELASSETPGAAPVIKKIPDDGFDRVQTRSGEWLKGELIAVEDHDLKFDSDEFGLQSIDWDDVAQLHTAAAHAVVVDQTTYTGHVHMLDDRVEILLADGSRRVIERWRVHRIVLSSERERDRWYAELSLGVNATRGNSNSGSLTAGFGFGRVGAWTDFDVRYDGTVTSANRTLSANRHRATATVAFFVAHDVAVIPALGLVQRDAFRNIALQALPAAGVRWDAISLAKLDCSLGAGGGYLYNLTVSSPAGRRRDTHDLGFLMFTKIDWDPTKWLELELAYQTVLVPTNFGLSNHHFRGGVEFDVTDILDIDFAFVWDRIERPLPDAEGFAPLPNDFQFITSVTIELGAVH